MRLFNTLLLLVFGFPVFAQQNAKDWYDAAQKSMGEKKYALAVDQLIKATELAPEMGEAWYQMGWCYNELEEWNKALSVLDKAENGLGTQARIFFERGYAYKNTGNTTKAKQSFEQAISLKPGYLNAHRELGNVLYEMKKDYLAALTSYKFFVRLAPPEEVSAKYWFRKAFCEVEANLPDSALNSLRQSLAKDSTYVEAWNEMGYIHYVAGMADQAIAAYEKAQSIDSANSTTAKGLGDTYRVLLQDAKTAYKYYQQAIRYRPENPSTWFGLAWCYNDMHEFDKAVEASQKSIELNGSEPLFQAELGYGYYGQKKWNLALETIDLSLGMGETALAYYYKGLVYIALKDKKKAEAAYDKLAAFHSENAALLRKKIDDMK